MLQNVAITIADEITTLSLGVVVAENVTVQPANNDLRVYANEVAARVLHQQTAAEFEQQCQQVRQLLRFGKFKASGRSKPAQEYLLRCVNQDGGLPVINGPVDLINTVSLDVNLPISLLSLRKCSPQLVVTRGRSGQTFVFNSAGQSLELEDLLIVADASQEEWRPVGSPIKDSMAGKIETNDRDLVALIYAPRNPAAILRCQTAMERLAHGFRDYCQATRCETRQLPNTRSES